MAGPDPGGLRGAWILHLNELLVGDQAGWVSAYTSEQRELPPSSCFCARLLPLWGGGELVLVVSLPAHSGIFSTTQCGL